MEGSLEDDPAGRSHAYGEPVKDFVSTASTNNHRGGEMAGEKGA
jgi:hypothetical protein